MRAKEALKLVKQAHDRAHEQIGMIARGSGEGRDGMYARGLASEGYLGGYRDALQAVMLLLNGVIPNDFRGYHLWDENERGDI